MTFATEAEAREWLGRITKQFGVTQTIAIPTTHGYWVVTGDNALERPPDVCAICGEEFREYPNNPQPVAEGICCAYCDDHVVTPARIALMNRPYIVREPSA